MILKEIEQRTCKCCAETKNIEEFTKKKQCKMGYSRLCKLCASEYSREHYEKNPNYYKERYQSIREDALKDGKERYRSNPELALLKGAKQRARRKDIPLDITVEDIVIPQYCPILNIELKVSEDHPSANSPSLDRIVPELGYVKGNIQVISNKANRIKSDASPEELKLFSNWVLNVLLKGLKHP